MQRLQQDIDQAWRGSYLQSLQARSKWRKKGRNPETGDIVYIKYDTLNINNRWPLGKIVKTFPGPEGSVRVVNVLCNGKVDRRGTSMLVPVIFEADEPAAAAASKSVSS